MKTFEESLTNLLIAFNFDKCAKYIKALGFPKQYQLDDTTPLDGDSLRYYIVENFREKYNRYGQKAKDLEVITVSTGRFEYKMYYDKETGYDLRLAFVPIDADTF